MPCKYEYTVQKDPLRYGCADVNSGRTSWNKHPCEPMHIEGDCYEEVDD